jgi:hypothetical protein
MEITSIRLKPGTVARLKAVAHKESLRGRETTWASLVRGVIEKHILADEEPDINRRAAGQ